MNSEGRAKGRLLLQGVAATLAFGVSAAAAADGSGTDNADLLRGTYGTGCLSAILCGDPAPQAGGAPLATAPSAAVTPASTACLDLTVSDQDGPECGAPARDDMALTTASLPGEPGPVEPGGITFDWSTGLRGSISSSRAGVRYQIVATPQVSAILHAPQGDTAFAFNAEVDQTIPQTPRLGSAEFSATTAYAVSPNSRFDGSASLSLSQDSTDGISVASTIAAMPVIAEGKVAGGISYGFGRFDLGLTGKAGRQVFSDTELNGGGWSSNTYRNTTSFGAGASVAFEMTPLSSVFGEVSAERAQFDAASPSLGVLEDAWTYEARSGLRGKWGELGQAEIWGGYFTRQFDAGTLAPVAGWEYGGKLSHEVTQTLTLTADASTTISAAGDVAGASARIGHDVSLSAQYVINDWISARGLASAYRAEYAGTADYAVGYTLGVGLDVQVARQVAMTIDYQLGYDETLLSNQHRHRITVGTVISR